MQTTRTDSLLASRAGARDPAQLRRSNVRTALALASIAATFFVGVIATKFMGGYEVGMSVVGFGVFLFLCLAIGRNLRKGR
jgi:hypothetical protein